MFYSEIDKNGMIVRSQFTEDPNFIVQQGNRLVEDNPIKPEDFNFLTHTFTRIEPVTGNKVAYEMLVRKHILEQFDISICPVPVNIADFSKLTSVKTTVQNLRVVSIDLSQPIIWKFRPFNRNNYFHRQVVVNGEVTVEFLNGALENQVMKPGEVWPLNMEYENIDQFKLTGSTPDTKIYCLVGDQNNRMIEDINGNISIGGIKFRQEFVI